MTDRAAELVARWEHGDEKHRQWLRDIAIPDIRAFEAEVGRATLREAEVICQTISTGLYPWIPNDWRSACEKCASDIRALDEAGAQSGTSSPINTTGATAIVGPNGVHRMSDEAGASEAPDPTMALASFFRMHWDDPNAGSIERTKWDDAAISCGLIVPDSQGFDYELTDLGRAALALAGERR